MIIVVQDAVRFFLLSELRIRVYVDYMNLFQKEISIDLLERNTNVHELLKVYMEKVHLELSVTRGDKRNSSMWDLFQPEFGGTKPQAHAPRRDKD